MISQGRSSVISLLDFKSIPMRTFHMTWLSFFVCFIAWFAIAPLMPIIRDELHLTKKQIGDIMIASMAITVLARLALGFVCDHYGPRRTYTVLLVVGSLPVMGIGLANSPESFLIFRVLIGVVGASFVLTQFHTSMMFAPNVVGAANATTAGWGNLGGGIAQILMPLIFALFLGLGFSSAVGWRLSMIIPGLLMLACSYLYWKFTRDTPLGDFADLKTDRRLKGFLGFKGFLSVLTDARIWALFVIYGACFGIELTVYNSASLYFTDKFHLSLTAAGVVAGLHGVQNIFGRTLGGVLGDRVGIRYGLRGRAMLLMGLVALEGVGLYLFSLMNNLFSAVIVMLIFSLFVQMACGATYSIVPFINRKKLGVVSGIIGAGGNLGAVFAGFLFRSESLSAQTIYGYIGIAVVFASSLALLVRFSPYVEAKEQLSIRKALEQRQPVPALGS